MSLLFSAFILTGTCFAQTPPPAQAPVGPTAVPVAVKPVHHEHHPEIHKAMRKLRGAKEDLEKASSNYGGHKVRAIEAINHALAELQEALNFAQAHQ